MRVWFLMFAGLWTHGASACSVLGNPGFHVPRHAVPGGKPAAPSVEQPRIGRGRGGRPNGMMTSCDDIGWLTFEFLGAPPDGDVGYLFTVVAGQSPIHLGYGPVATREGVVTMSWIDGATHDQEPFSFVVNVQTVSTTGARSLPVPVVVVHPGTGSLMQTGVIPLTPPPTLAGDCGVLSTAPDAPLSDEQAACMDAAFVQSTSAERREEASWRLIAYADGLPDKREWERLVRRHLEEVDGADYGLGFDLAVHLVGSGPENAEAAIRWADVTLGQSANWRRDAYISRVYSLKKIRAVAAGELWRSAESLDERDLMSNNSQALPAAQQRARDYAREFYRFAVMSDQGLHAPLQMCLSAGGSQEWCTSTSGD